jgi:hypothetical protein
LPSRIKRQSANIAHVSIKVGKLSRQMRLRRASLGIAPSARNTTNSWPRAALTS